MPVAENLGDPHRMHHADDANVSLLALLGLQTTAADGAEREARITGETAGVGNGRRTGVNCNQQDRRYDGRLFLQHKAEKGLGYWCGR
jgi:hypothetical protein